MKLTKMQHAMKLRRRVGKNLYLGNKPEGSTQVAVKLGSGWVLYEVREVDKDGWAGLKLVSFKPRRKANFWLYYNPAEARLAGNRHSKQLQDMYPKAYLWTVNAAINHYKGD
jgi:hypothetical protein